jgi:hypothetical protein
VVGDGALDQSGELGVSLPGADPALTALLVRLAGSEEAGCGQRGRLGPLHGHPVALRVDVAGDLADVGELADLPNLRRHFNAEDSTKKFAPSGDGIWGCPGRMAV